MLVVVLPFSDRFWAEGFCDMRQRSWQDGQAHAFEDFGGVPRMLVPDNAATATNRGDPRVTVVNEEYARFAEHYGCAVVPARVRKPRDKSTSESTVDLVEKWVIAPANEQTFYTLAEFNEFCAERVAWLNARPFSGKDGSRDSVYESEELPRMQPLPESRYETCEWRSAKVAPDYHVKCVATHFTWNGQLRQMRSWPDKPQVARCLHVRQLRISLRGQGLKPAQDTILALPDRLVHIDLYAAAPL